jgi:hypothetical protein
MVGLKAPSVRRLTHAEQVDLVRHDRAGPQSDCERLVMVDERMVAWQGRGRPGFETAVSRVGRG